jgi:hypothetical protein
MKYLLEVADADTSFAEKFFRNVAFVKKIKQIEANEITNPAILKSIEDYENHNSKPTPLSLAELKAFINA